jgi:hypothetical protein
MQAANQILKILHARIFMSQDNKCYILCVACTLNLDCFSLVQIQVTWDYSENFNGICTAMFWTFLGPITPFLSYFSIMEWAFPAHVCPITVFWKHIICRLYRFSAGEKDFIRMNYMSSVTHLLFRWYLNETLTLTFGADVRTNKDFWGCSNGMNVFSMW